MSDISVGTRVECEDCNGQHKGLVVANLGGRFWGVAWEDRNPNFGKPGNTEPQFPDHFLAEHTNHIASVGELAFRPVS